MQPKTLQIILGVLSEPRFTQRGLWRSCNREAKVSIGHVNKVIKDLIDKGFVEYNRSADIFKEIHKTGLYRPKMKNSRRSGYILIDPVGLLRYIALFRSMKNMRLFTISVNAAYKEINTNLIKRNVIFCLGTAMNNYSAYYKPGEISFYHQNPEDIYDYLSTARSGNSRISCYKIDYVQGELNGYTTEVQTVVDMFCDGKGVYTKPLVRKLWGIEI